MKNFVEHGHSLTYANGTGADITSGDVVVVGNQIGVAVTDIPDGQSGTVSMVGVFTLPKAAGAAIVQGDAVVWDASASAFAPSSTTLATDDVSGACTAWEAAASAATTVVVKINTGVGTVTA